MSLPVAGSYLLSRSLVMAYREPPVGRGASMFPGQAALGLMMGDEMLRKYWTVGTAAGLSTFSDRLARLCAASAFVLVQPPVPTVRGPAARLGEALVAPRETASTTTEIVLPSKIFP